MYIPYITYIGQVQHKTAKIMYTLWSACTYTPWHAQISTMAGQYGVLHTRHTETKSNLYYIETSCKGAPSKQAMVLHWNS